MNEIRDNGIDPCDTMKKKKKEREIIVQEEKKRSDVLKRDQKIYGFRNEGNNCYLNSSLQLLAKIKDLKDEVINSNEPYPENETKGKLMIELEKCEKNLL